MSHVFDLSVVTALYQKAVPLFRPPYDLEYTVTPHSTSCVVLFALRKGDRYVAHVSVVYTVDNRAICDHVDSAIGHHVGSFLFLLHYRLAMECGVRLFTLDNMTDDPPRAARGIYSMLICQEGREGEEIPLAYLDHMEGRPPRPGNVVGALKGPDMVGVPYVPESSLVVRAWNVALRRLWDRVSTLWSPENGGSPWSPRVRETMKSLFLSYHPMTLRSFLPSL